MSQHTEPVRISLLALPQTTPAAVYGLYEVLSAVGSMWDRLTGQQTNARRIVP